MLKRKMAVVLSFALVLSSFVGMASANGAAKAAGTLKIGVVEPMSGGFASFGTSAKNGILMLQDDVNKAGGINGMKVEFDVQDDTGVPAVAATVGAKLINEDKVVAIVGPLTSGCANALAPIAVQSKIPLISGTATNPTVTQNGPYIFRACFIDPFQGTVVAKFAYNNLKAKKAAVLFDNGNDYSKGLAKFFQEGFKKNGGTIVDVETYNTNDKDFNAQLTKIKAKKPDFILLPDYYNVVGVIARQARALGITCPLGGGDGWDSADLTKVGGKAVENCYFSDHYTPTSTAPMVKSFVAEYKAKYGTVPDSMAALNYDAAKIMLDAIKKAKSTDGDKIRQALVKEDINVVSGHVKFDANRDAVKSAVILKVEKGVFKYVTTVNP